MSTFKVVMEKTLSSKLWPTGDTKSPKFWSADVIVSWILSMSGIEPPSSCRRNMGKKGVACSFGIRNLMKEAPEIVMRNLVSRESCFRCISLALCLSNLVIGILLSLFSQHFNPKRICCYPRQTTYCCQCNGHFQPLQHLHDNLWAAMFVLLNYAVKEGFFW